MSAVPDYRGIFLRGLGNQVVDGVNHTSSSLGSGQGDSSREMDGTIGLMAYGGSVSNSDNGGTVHPGGSRLSGNQPFWQESRVHDWLFLSDSINWPAFFKHYRYGLSGDKDSGYSLIETPEFPPQVQNASSGIISFDVSRVWPVSNEFRPVNKSVRYMIKAR